MTRSPLPSYAVRLHVAVQVGDRHDATLRIACEHYAPPAGMQDAVGSVGDRIPVDVGDLLDAFLAMDLDLRAVQHRVPEQRRVVWRERSVVDQHVQGAVVDDQQVRIAEHVELAERPGAGREAGHPRGRQRSESGRRRQLHVELLDPAIGHPQADHMRRRGVEARRRRRSECGSTPCRVSGWFATAASAVRGASRCRSPRGSCRGCHRSG